MLSFKKERFTALADETETTSNLNPLEGMLSHITS